MELLSCDIQDNILQIDKLLGYEISFDIGRRRLVIVDKEIYLYYVNLIVNSSALEKIITNLLKVSQNDLKDSYFKIITNNITNENVSYINNFKDIIKSILDGLLVIVIEGEETALKVDIRDYPTRGIAEPDMEKVIRGPHDGFTESLSLNIALLRRRVKDGNLRNIVYEVGNETQTTVCLSYIKGICDEDLIKEVQNKIINIDIPHLLMTDKALEEIMLHQKMNPFPLVRYTERADTVAVHLYQGMIAIFVDTSPSVILAPATYFDHLQHTEEYRQTPLSGSYLRILRFIGVFISLFATPLFFLFYKYPSINPSLHHYIFPTQDNKLPIFWQLILAEGGVELLRMASIHTPNALSTAMGLIAGVLIGDIAIRVGLFCDIVVLLVSLSAVGTYATPSFELGLANKISKLLFLLVIFIFGFWGFVVFFILWIIYLSSLKSFKKPYFYPLIPLDIKTLFKLIVRQPYKNKR